MGQPASMTDVDRERAEYIAEWIWRGVLEDEGAPGDMLKRCATQFGLDVDYALLCIAMVLLEHRTKLRDFSAAHLQALGPPPDLVTEAQQALQADVDAMKRATQARAAYGKPSKATRVRLDRGDFERVSGMVLCEVCQVEYSDHDPVIGFPWLRHGCDGRLLKP